MTLTAWNILRELNKKKRNKVVNKNICLDKKDSWKCMVCNKTYTLQNKYYHFDSHIHKNNLNILNKNLN